MSTVDTITSFTHANLNEIDPSFDCIPEDMYTLKILKVELKDFAYKEGNKKGIPVGTPGQYIKFNLAVTDHEKFAGRRVFPTLFPNAYSLKVLRRLADKTGVPQEPEEPLDGWLARMSEIQPEFKTKVEFAKDREGKVLMNDYGKPADNAVDWRTILPVG